MKIITNNHKRPLMHYHELSEEDQKFYDYAKESEFFSYRGQMYCLADFILIDWLGEKWQAYYGNSFFSGIVMRYAREYYHDNTYDIDYDFIVCGLYLS